MIGMPKIPCSRCGSKNTELRDSPRDGPLPLRLAERLLRPLRPGGMAGRQAVVCRDCGHVFLVQVR